MPVAALLARGRAAAERLMVDECLIRRKVGEATDDDGHVVPEYALVYSGRCRFQQPAAQARSDQAGQALVLMLRLEVHLPMSVTGVRARDEVLAVESAHDPDLPGRTFIVRELAHKSHATARRLGIEERT